MNKSKKIAYVSSECVACGCCMKVCPLQAISVPKGIRAEIDENKCVGCAKCALNCPARVITIHAKEEAYVNTETLV
jgi:ferredoxin